jgi:hypothetical protein
MDGLENKTKKKLQGLLNIDVKDILPLPVRAVIDTARGVKTPITNKDLTQENINQLDEYIQKTRELRGQTIPNKNIPYFDTGAGYVNYDLINQMGLGRRDWNFTDDAAVHNTLGQFNYKTLPNGNILVTDRYDYYNDNPGMLSKEQAATSRYAGMNPFKKVGLLAYETIKPGLNDAYANQGVINDLKQGLLSFPSRAANAFLGENPRDVSIEFKPSKKLKTKEEIRPTLYDADKLFETDYISQQLLKQLSK